MWKGNARALKAEGAREEMGKERFCYGFYLFVADVLIGHRRRARELDLIRGAANNIGLIIVINMNSNDNGGFTLDRAVVVTMLILSETLDAQLLLNNTCMSADRLGLLGCSCSWLDARGNAVTFKRV